MEEKETMKSKYYFENGDSYKYDPEAFERFYKEYESVFKACIMPTFKKNDLLRKWVKAHGTRIPKVEIKKGDFVVAFSKTGLFSFSGFAHHTVFNVNTECWQTEDGYTFEKNHKKIFICPTYTFLSRDGFGSVANSLVPHTIEEAEMFCQEVKE